MSDVPAFSDFITRIRAGDEHAAAELVRRYEPIIRREVRMQLDDQKLIRAFDSMDFCQSVLASFFLRTAAGEYDLGSPAQLVRLLVSMARNKLISAARREYSQRRDLRRRTGRGDPELDQVVDKHPQPPEELANNELLGQIYGRLSPEELQMSQLRSQGASWADVASAMGSTPQSRRMQLSRAIDRISGELGLDVFGESSGHY